MNNPTWLDRAIAWLNPQAGMERARARYITDVLNKHGPRNRYEGASRGRRTEGWTTSSTAGANVEVAQGLGLLRERSRDLVRNNPYAARAVSVIANHVVGTGIIPQIKGTSKTQTENLQAIVKDHLLTTAIDADGRNSFLGIQKISQRTITEGGSVLLRRRRRRPADGLPLPFQIQVLEGDYLDVSKSGSNGNNPIRYGIEYTPFGKRAAYWIFPEHPGEYQYNAMYGNSVSQRVPASEIIHCYRMDRPGQMNGVPWAAPVVIRMREFDEYEDAQLVRQKIAACFTAFVYDSEFGSPLDSPTQDADSDGLREKLEPGVIELLPNGKRVEFASPPSVENYGEYARNILHAIGAGFGVPYDLLTGDQSQVNFASGRMGRLSFYQDVDEWRWQMLIPHVCHGICNWFLESAQMNGVNATNARFTHSPPRRQMINPEKEVAATRDEVRSGQITPSEVIRQRGHDPDEFFEEYKNDMQRFDDLGIILDCDPRNTNRAGGAQGEAISQPEVTDNGESKETEGED